uniref:ATPase of the ABC class n=1 Tax=Noctiluca scintillans TaxID=2966 RepID=A0A7S1F5U0_NOCSC
MGKGKGGGGGYPWWEHVKSKGGGKSAGHEEKAVMKAATSGTSLQRQLEQYEGKSYPCYKDLMGGPWEMEGCACTVVFDRVQGDPYAPPSWVRVQVSDTAAKFPAEYVSRSKIRNTALCDFVTRVMSDMLQGGTGTDWTQAVAGHGWGGSKGGDVKIDAPGQCVLPRSSVVATSSGIEARLTLSLPARGRSIEGHRAAQILGGLMDVVKKSLFFKSLDQKALKEHILSVEDQESARSQLAGEGLVAFVANGSVLPRKSGVDDRPMTQSDDPNLVLFQSPSTLEVNLHVPNRGVLTGMGIRKGITMVVGGGFHGKSTLLQALQIGVYNKVDGDGREFVVCDPKAVKIRAEDGRSVCCTDISPFINNLPFGRDTRTFSSADASGSTSQAANIVESLELGATAFLIDEDTCATNFMIRDAPMQELVAPEKEPITPFIRKVRPLFEEEGVSTVMVIGGSGDFFPVADTVICMERYQASDVTEAAKQIASRYQRVSPDPVSFDAPTGARIPLREGLAAGGKVAAKSCRCITYGDTEVELTFVEQLVETSQARAVGDALQLLASSAKFVDETRPLSEVVSLLEGVLQGESKEVGVQGLDELSRSCPCPFYAMPRRFELGAALNRLRTAKILRRAVDVEDVSRVKRAKPR